MFRQRLALLKKPRSEPDVPRCWVCRRSTYDFQVLFDRPTPREVEAEGLIAKVDDSRVAFRSTLRQWKETIPNDYKETDFSYMSRDPDQFEFSISIREILATKKYVFDALAGVSRGLKGGKRVTLGVIELNGSNSREKAFLARELRGFERRTGWRLGDPSLLGGADLGRWIVVMGEIGMLFFSVQRGILDIQLEAARRARLKVSVAQVSLGGLATPVPLCGVCERLIQRPQSATQAQ